MMTIMDLSTSNLKKSQLILGLISLVALSMTKPIIIEDYNSNNEYFQRYDYIELAAEANATAPVVDNVIKTSLGSPRCGVPDIKYGRRKRYSISQYKWWKRHITYFLSNWTSHLSSRQMVLNELERAFQLWSDISPLTFKHVEDNAADIVVSFISGKHNDQHHFDGFGGVLAHAYHPIRYYPLGGDIHFDNDEKWVSGHANYGADFFTVAVHEIGHSLGLQHSNNLNSVMYNSFAGYKPHFRLGYDDVLAMNHLYGSGKFEEDDFSIKTKHTTSPTMTWSNWTPDSTDPIPDLCDGLYDSISTIRGELFVFRGQYMWRFQERNIKYVDPIKFTDLFPFPKSVTRIDTVLEDSWGNIYFFSGRQIYVFDGTKFVDKWPRSLTDLNIKSTVTKLDAIFVWTIYKKTYLISGSKFWRYNSESLTMDKGHPKNMLLWRGLPNHIDSAINWKGD